MKISRLLLVNRIVEDFPERFIEKAFQTTANQTQVESTLHGVEL